MAIADDDVLAYRALRELSFVYDAYRAAARAHAAILSRASIPPAGREPMDDDVLIRLEERRALARQTDVVCGIRADQVQSRMAQLRSSRTP